MQHYYVDNQAKENGVHEVHTPRCSYLPEGENGLYLGSFTNCSDALHAASGHYEKVNGCSWCCSTCHTE
ncbi:MAG TPA: hypothetical protein VEC35_01745 [Noviherbaspirillum sp.]|nr:hypothetical protein [Noviherbaspirillum sp.]